MFAASPSKKKSKFLSFILAFAYFFVNFLTLTTFPLVHSDEVWLGKLSATYLQSKSIFVTEPFFALFPRQAHTLKSLFHLLQSAFIFIFGETIFSLRFLSLVFGMFALVLLWYLLGQFKVSYISKFLISLFIATQVQFIYAMHFGRQEIILICIAFACLLICYRPSLSPVRKHAFIALLIGASIGFHPNSFILALMFGCLILLRSIDSKKLKPVFVYGFILMAWAVFYIATSFIGNGDFIKDYYDYGSTLAVNAGPLDRFINFRDFYIKLYKQIGATYYLPNIRLTLLLPIILLLPSLYLIIRCKITQLSRNLITNGYVMYIGFNIALLIIGRYNPTSIVFMLVPLSLMITGVSSGLNQLFNKWLLIIPLSLLIIHNLNIVSIEYGTFSQADYDTYIQELAYGLEDDAVILGNLSGGFAFNDYVFYDIRDLAYLDGQSVKSYMKNQGINTLVYYESYDYIHRNPSWQILYGDDAGYYDELQEIILENGSLVHEFTDAYYGNRIISYIGDYPWTIQVYTIDLEDD